MGLQNHPSDVSSESILLFTVVLVANGLTYLHSLLHAILRTLGLLAPDHEHHHHHSGGSLRDAVGSGLASLIVLRGRPNCNQSDAAAGDLDADCVVCLNRLGEAHHLCRLACRHVFHKDCLDRWLDYLNFNCPLCRAPLEADERVLYARRRGQEDLLAWFPFQ